MVNCPKEFWDYCENSGKAGTDFAMGLFDMGKKYTTKDNTDWHDLTAAIESGKNIDWERLHQRRAKCEHKTMGALVSTLERDAENPADWPLGWINSDGQAWESALIDSWYGYQGWTLYIYGPIPLKPKTADQLKPGTCFIGYLDEFPNHHLSLIVFENKHGDLVCTDGTFAGHKAKDFQVLEVRNIGTFKAGG